VVGFSVVSSGVVGCDVGLAVVNLDVMGSDVEGLSVVSLGVVVVIGLEEAIVEFNSEKLLFTFHIKFDLNIYRDVDYKWI
jgi:hypothetical protein